MSAKPKARTVIVCDAIQLERTHADRIAVRYLSEGIVVHMQEVRGAAILDAIAGQLTLKGLTFYYDTDLVQAGGA